MAMTLEQKVAKKAKSFTSDNLKYKKGLAIVIESIDEEAVEYDTDCTYSVKLHFKSKASIKRVADALGNFKFDKKRVTGDYDRGVKTYKCNLSSYELFTLEAGLNIHRVVRFYYQNHYTGSRFGLNIDPRQALPKEYADKYTGSTADGESFSGYYKGLQEQIIKGGYTYLV